MHFTLKHRAALAVCTLFAISARAQNTREIHGPSPLIAIEHEVPKAEEAARNAVNLRPNFAEAHKRLGIVFASEAKVQEAEKEFLTAIRLNPDDAETFMDLGSIHGQEGRYSDAVNEFSKAIELNPHADFIAAAKDRLARSRAKLNTTHIHHIDFVPPHDYTESTFTEALRQKLTPEEFKLVVNPLASTPEMDRWARTLTADATNDEARARILFETLAYNAAGENGQPTQVAIRTARETFAVWNTPGAALNCQDYEYLYVALARSVGIKAYAVDVQENVDGGKMPHACAAVIVDGKGLLVDPTVPWFGVPHKRFTLMDDLQVSAIYVDQIPSLKYSEIASKLAPDVALVQLNLLEKLTAEGRLKEARELLPRLKRLDINEATGDYVEARLALIEGNTESAIELLLKAIAIDPNEGNYHTRLANAYAQEGKLSAARESLQNALRCPMTTAEAELPRKLIANTNELAIWGYFGRAIGLQNKGDLDGAMKCYDEIILLNPARADAYNNRGVIKQMKGDSKGAQEDFSKANALNPKMPPSIEHP
jgi:tetratricopeptide (TPR) repeat protein